MNARIAFCCGDETQAAWSALQTSWGEFFRQLSVARWKSPQDRKLRST